MIPNRHCLRPRLGLAAEVELRAASTYVNLVLATFLLSSNLALKETFPAPSQLYTTGQQSLPCRKDIYMLARIQGETTKLIPGLRDLSYEGRLKEWGDANIKEGSNRCFNIYNSPENIASNIFVKILLVLLGLSPSSGVTWMAMNTILPLCPVQCVLLLYPHTFPIHISFSKIIIRDR